MRRVCLPGLAGLLGLALLAGGSSFAADQPTTKNADATKKANTEKKADAEKHTANKPVAPEGVNPASSTMEHKGFRAHLPAHFGRIGLSKEQHQQLKAVMDKYSGQIKELETQLGEVKAKRDSELHALLSEAQKKALEEAKSLAAKAREDAKAAGQQALAAGSERLRAMGEATKARQKRIQEGLAKFKESQEQAKNAKSKPDSKEAPAGTPKEKSNPTEKQPEKR
jgi:hypothetical protein